MSLYNQLKSSLSPALGCHHYNYISTYWLIQLNDIQHLRSAKPVSLLNGSVVAVISGSLYSRFYGMFIHYLSDIYYMRIRCNKNY